jgi:hypothetical protein
MTRDGGSAILRDFEVLVAALPSTYIIRAVVGNAYSEPEKVLAIRNGSREATS